MIPQPPRREADNKEKLSASANTPFSKTGITESKEAEPMKNIAADKVLGLLVYNSSGDEIPESLLKKSGKALANRFLFALISDEAAEGGFFVRFAPMNDRSYDQHLTHIIEHLLPPMADPEMTREIMEATFDFSDYKDPVALAKELMRHGFVWEREFQEENDAGSRIPTMPRLKTLENTAAPERKTGNPPPKP